MSEEGMLPEFEPGEEIMWVDPSGEIPWPVGPYTVIGCVHCEYDFKLYVVECKTHGRHVIDGVEMVGLDEWHHAFQARAS